MDNIQNISDEQVWPDGSVSFRVDGDAGGSIELRLTPGQAGELVAFICRSFEGLAAAFPIAAQDGRPRYHYGPLQCTGVGWARTQDPSTVLMVVNLPCFAPAFEIPRSQLADMARRAAAI